MERRSIFRRIGFLPLSLVLAFVGADAGAAPEVDSNLYDGLWTVRIDCGGAARCPARLELKDFDGTWQDLSGANASKRACGGKKIPVTVQSSTRSQLAFTVFGDGT